MTETPTDSLSGTQLREMFASATAWLERNIEQVNAINVFPVPDGDTGTNMYLTMRSTMEEAERCEEESAAAVLAAMAHGALMGARGNSGVILSQIIAGIARAAEGLHSIDARAFAAGLTQATASAYRAVTTPREGTILTVIRETAEAVRARVEQGPGSLLDALETAVSAARAAVEKTPSLLPVLAEAGVVDAGGEGLCLIFEGMLYNLKGERIESVALMAGPAREWVALAEQRHQTEESPYGYCTEVLISGRALDVDAARQRMSQIGDSVLVVGDERALRVHVHTDDPGAVLSYGTSVGSLSQVKVDNIREQAERFVEMHREAKPTAGPISSVAVASGRGLAEVFTSMGCTRVVPGGPTMNPSAREILEAIESCPTEQVIVLPNDKNIIMTAEQAAGMSSRHVRVVPTRSIPQGVAALLALNQDGDLATNAREMEEAAQSVRTIEVTRAVRSTTLSGVRVGEGEFIAVVDDELKLAAGSAEEAVEEALDGLIPTDTSLITIYYGADVSEEKAQALAERLVERFSGYEVEVVYGGQPHYSYLVSLE